MEFNRLTPSTQTLRYFLTFGGLPYLSNLPLQRDIVFEYLRNVYSTIMLKDVVRRENIRNVDFLETLALYTADNVGNLFSANNISRYLKSQRVNISPLQVINYLRSLQRQYYFEDLGLRNCHFGFNMQSDIHKLMENAIYLHLANKQYEVFTGQLAGGREVDFVARKNDEVVYIQSSYLMNDEATRQREFGNLQSIADNYPKYDIILP